MRVVEICGPSVAVACLVGISAWCVVRTFPNTRVYCLVSAIILAVPWLAAVAYYTHVFDGPEYFTWRAQDSTPLWIGLIGALPFGAVALAKNAQQGFVRGMVMMCCLVAIPYAKPALLLLPSEVFADRWIDGVCLQTSRSSCGACATATVLRTLGVERDESEVAAGAYTSRTGTLNWYLARYVRSVGLDVAFREPSTVKEVSPPAVLGVILGNGVGHFVALISRDGDNLTVGEPLEGRLLLSAEEFASRYQFDRFAMEVSLPEARVAANRTSTVDQSWRVDAWQAR